MSTPVVILSQAQVLELKRGGTSKRVLHGRMREFLDTTAAANPGQRDGATPMRAQAPAELPWKEYIAKHPEADSIVGNGLVSFSLCFVAGTRDPNRRGQMRLDYVAEQVPTDGAAEYVYLHPGSTSKTDAKVRYIHEAADTWIRDKETALRSLENIPPHLRYGRRQAFQTLNAILRDVPECTRAISILVVACQPWRGDDPSTGATEYICACRSYLRMATCRTRFAPFVLSGWISHGP